MRCLLLLLLAGSAEAGTRQQSITIMPEQPDSLKLHEAWGFSEAIVVGDTVYLSGVVVGMPRTGSDLKPAYSQAFERIGQVLQRAGSSWDDVIEITSYHTDVTSQMPAMVAVKNKFVKAPYPAWTAVEVSRLIPDRGITEIKLTAKLRPSS